MNLLRGKLQGTGAIKANLEFNYFPLYVENEEQLTLYALEEQDVYKRQLLFQELHLI